MQIELHVSEINAAIALFSGVAEKFRDQALAQSQTSEAPNATETPQQVVHAAPTVKKTVKRR